MRIADRGQDGDRLLVCGPRQDTASDEAEAVIGAAAARERDR
jgi:hypothetical protein